MGLRQQPVPPAIESDHHSFQDVRDRCAQKNEAPRREARVKQECANDACARGDLCCSWRDLVAIQLPALTETSHDHLS